MGQYHCSTWALVALCLTFALNVLHVQGGWVNDYDQAFIFQCGPGQFLQSIVSQHHNTHEDRQFHLSCRNLPHCVTVINAHCQWTRWVNSFQDTFNYECPNDGYVAGLESEHSNKYEDRRFNFYCCNADELERGNCEWSAELNAYDGLDSYVVPVGMVLIGMYSTYDDNANDRIFKYRSCKVWDTTEN